MKNFQPDELKKLELLVNERVKSDNVLCTQRAIEFMEKYWNSDDADIKYLKDLWIKNKRIYKSSSCYKTDRDFVRAGLATRELFKIYRLYEKFRISWRVFLSPREVHFYVAATSFLPWRQLMINQKIKVGKIMYQVDLAFRDREKNVIVCFDVHGAWHYECERQRLIDAEKRFQFGLHDIEYCEIVGPELLHNFSGTVDVIRQTIQDVYLKNGISGVILPENNYIQPVLYPDIF